MIWTVNSAGQLVVDVGTQPIDVGGTVTVLATDLDVRDLAYASDSVTAHQGGTWTVGVSGTVAVSAASLPLPAGAAAEATLAALSAKVVACDTGAVVISSGSVTVSATNLDVRDLAYATDSVTAVQGGAWTVGVSGTVPVSAAALPLPAGAATEATLAALSAKVAACDTGAVVVASGAVTVSATDLDIRNLANASDSVTAHQGGVWSVRAQDGDGNALTSAARGAERALSVQLVDGSGNQITSFGGGSGGTSHADDAAFAVGSAGSVTPVAGVATSDTVDAGDAGAVAMTVYRGLHVNLRDSSGNEVAVGGGTQYAEDAASGGGEQLTLAGAVRRDAPAEDTSADGDYATLKTDSVGRLWVRVGDTVAVSAASLPLPAGAAAEATLAALSAKVVACDTGAVVISSGSVTVSATNLDVRDLAYATDSVTAVQGGVWLVSAAQSGVWTVGVSGTVAVSAVSLPLPAGAATEATLSTLNGKVTACDTGAVVISSGAVTVSATNLDVRDLTSVSDSVTAHQGGAWTVAATQSGAWSVGVTGTVAVSAASLPLPAGAATEATLSALNGKVTACDTGAVVIASGAVTVSATNLDVRNLTFVSDSVSAVQSGAWSVGVTGTVAVSAAALPLPTGAATEATLSTLNGKVTACNTGAVVIASGAVTVSATDLDVRDLTSASDSVAAVQSGAWSVRAQDGAGNNLTSAARGSEQALSVQLVDGSGNQITSFGGTGGTQYTEDDASAADPTGPLLVGRRRDTPAAETTADGDNVALNATNKGELYVKHLDAVAVTDGGGVLTVDGTVSVGNTVAVSASSLPLPTGAATEATLSALNGKVTACDTGAVVIASGAVTVSATNLDVRDLAYATDSVTAVQGGVWTVGISGTVPVSAAALPLPAGAATEATLAGLDAKVTACDTGAVVISSGSVTVSATNLDVRDLTSVSDSVSAVQSGTWTVGVSGTVPVSAAALPLPAGAATEATLSTLNGKVTACDTGAVVISSGAVTVSATNLDVRDLTFVSDSVTAVQGGTWTVAVSGTVAVSASSLPLPTGAATEATLSTLNGKVTACNTGAVVVASGAVAATQSGAWSTRTQDGAGNAVTSHTAGASRGLDVCLLDASGGHLTTVPTAEARGSTASLSNVSGSASSVTLLAANTARKQVVIYNDSAAALYVKYGTTASATSFTYLVPAYSTLESDVYAGRIDGIWASATGAARVTEVT